MAESPDSPLSSIASGDLTEDVSKLEDRGPSPSVSHMPPSKRRRTGVASWDRQTPVSSVHEDMVPASPTDSISSDSSGDIPTSPNTTGLAGGGGDEDGANDQVTVCRWDGCDVGDLGNMDDLVKHIHNDHIGTRQKKYSCEWGDCSRKGQTHASGYALRAHMRSHTREKPFFCALPECDRAFTRSDALAKHMRTVHETEALRPSDPVPKHHPPLLAAGSTPGKKLQRIKLKLSHPRKEDGGSEESGEGEHGVDDEGEFDPELGFDEHERSLPPDQLFRLLRRQIYWAEKETEKIKGEWETIEPRRKEEWRRKEAIFDDMIDAEMRAFKSTMAAERVPVGAAALQGGELGEGAAPPMRIADMFDGRNGMYGRPAAAAVSATETAESKAE